MSGRDVIVFQVGDREVKARFSARSLGEDVERQLGKTVMAWLSGMQRAMSETKTTDIGYRDTAIFLQAGMEVARRDALPNGKSGGRPVTLDEAYEVIDELGLGDVAGKVIASVAKSMRPEGAKDLPPEEPAPNG